MNLQVEYKDTNSPSCNRNYNISYLAFQMNGISRDTHPFESENNNDNIYIDNDRIGFAYNNL